LLCGFFLFSVPCFAQADTFTVCEADNATQTNRPITIGRVFADGEIANFPQPTLSGTGISSYQADVKNRYADGSVKFAIVSFVAPSLSAGACTTFGFTNNASGNNTGYITNSSSPSFATFNSGNWDAQIVTTPGAPSASAAAVTVSAKTMLGSSLPSAPSNLGDCGMDYWLQGPVVTAVIVQDCTATMAYDFGWHWNAANMASDGTHASYATTSQYASFHPMFILYFYPSLNSVECEEIIETPWNGKVQDQLADFTFKTDTSGGTLTTRWTRTGARVITVISATSTLNSPPAISTTQIVSSSANFVSTDVGLGVCVMASYTSYPNCGTIKSVTNSTTATMAMPTGTSSISGSGLTAWLDLQSAATRHRKTFWSGTAPGHIRIDYNFPYLIATKAIANYDLVNAFVTPATGYYPGGKCCDYGWGGSSSNGWTGTDRGDIDGFSGENADYAAVLEGAPERRQELAYLYNMGSANQGSNGKAAEAWQQLTGNTAIGDLSAAAALDTSTTTQYNVSGGGGEWDNFGNVPFHFRESRSTPTTNGLNGNSGSANCFYVSNFENRNATQATLVALNSLAACLGNGDGNVTDPTGPNNATGREISQYAHSDTAGPSQNVFGVYPPVGSALSPLAGYAVVDEGQYHWLDFSYLPYLLTGSPYYLESTYQAAAYETYGDSGGYTESAGIFNVYNSNYIYRWFAWAMQNTERAAFVAPDGSAEQSYWLSILNSNLEFVEGALGITGTTLTPSSSQGSFATSGTITNFNVNAANRWDLGRYNEASGYACNTTGSGSCAIIPAGLHQWTQGFCASADPTYLNTSVTSSQVQYWMYWYIPIVLGEARDLGYSQAAAVDKATMQFIEGMTLSPTGNPYAVLATYEGPVTSGGEPACTVNPGQNLPFFTRYGGLTGTTSLFSGVNATLTTSHPPSNFSNTPPPGGLSTGNFPCADHGYSLLARAAGSYLLAYGVNETDSDGTYTPSSTWSWLNTNVPYFGNAPYIALEPGDCAAGSDVQIKYALVPGGAAPNTSVITVQSSNPSSGVPITASPADNNSVSSGSTTFTLTYNNGTSVTLTAPSTASGNTFQSWSGCDSTAGFTCTLAPNTNRTVTVNYTTPPATATLTIASTNPASGVVISASPSDNNGHSSATTPGSLVYNVSTAVTLTAPATASGNNFNNWTGCTSSSGLTCNVTVSTNATITANYTPAPTTAVLTVASSNPASGVVITNSPADNSSLTSVTTPGTLTFNINTAVTLTAPATASGNNFANWSGCDLTSGVTCNVTMTANRTVTANYSTPPPTVTVNIHSTNPSTAVSIATSPADNNGLTGCSTACSFLYNAGASFTLTAPATAGANSFSSWSGCPSPSSNTCVVSSATATSITANYASPPTITLSVASQNPASGVTITVSPSDNNGHSSVITPGTLTYNANTAVTATAPGTASGNNFSAWLGCSASTNPCSITPAANATITAVYVTPPATATITVTSNGASSVNMSNQPADNNSVISGTTTFTLLYNVGTNIQVTAPLTASGSTVFRSWTGCTSTAGAVCNLTVGGNATITANYSAAPPAPTGLSISGWIGALLYLMGLTRGLRP
jgi:hypothetical protein